MKSFLQSFRLKLTRALGSFSKIERIAAVILAAIIFVSGIVVMVKLSRSVSVERPAYGGHLTEGVIGAPRFVNPLFANTESEKALTTLVYSGLVRKTSDGEYTPDLAESYEISTDGKRYTFHIREDLTFHDGNGLTSDDVVFTIDKLQDLSIKSPYTVSWQGVEVEKIDNHTIEFQLSQAFSGFLENTTVGILPEHIWGQLDNEEFTFSIYNARPIGSGPYKVSDVNQDREGIPTKYTLKAFKNFSLGRAYIQTIDINFYPNNDELRSAMKQNQIDSAGSLLPDDSLAKRRRLVSVPQSRLFGIFFNATKNKSLGDSRVIEAFDMAIDKNMLVDEVVNGYGSTLTGSLPLYMYQDIEYSLPDPEGALALLARAGWTPSGDSGTLKSSSGNSLAFSIATGNADNLISAAEFVAESLREIGVDVTVTVYESGQLTENIIRERDFEALVFGQSILHDTSLFAFWHSSQRTDPGLNITGYVNSKTDSLLSKARGTVDRGDRYGLYAEFDEAILSDRPALYLYAPDFTYLIPKNLKGVEFDSIAQPHERFALVNEWHVRTQHVWPFLLQDR